MTSGPSLLVPVAGSVLAAVVVGATVVGATVVVAAVVVLPATVVVVVGCTTFTDVVAREVNGPPTGPAFALNVMPLAVAGTVTTSVCGAAESGVDHVHVIASDVVLHDESPGVNETSEGSPPPLVVMLTCAGVELNAGIENTAVTTMSVPAVGLLGAAVMVAVMLSGACALTGAARRTRAAPAAPSADITFRMSAQPFSRRQRRCWRPETR